MSNLTTPRKNEQPPPVADSNSLPASRARFQTTIWTQVLNARNAEDTQSRQALEDLCRRYWFPIYSYVRRRGYSAHDAQDMAQGFFAELLGKNHLQRLKNREGRFRSFLLTSLKWFLANEWDRAQARKRGGAIVHVSLDDENAERRFQTDAQPEEPPEHGFDRQFARSGLQRAMKRLCAETDPARFALLGPHLVPDGGEASYREIAQQLEMTETAVKSSVRRLRRRCGELFREEIEATVGSPAEVDEEIHYLLSLLAGR